MSKTAKRILKRSVALILALVITLSLGMNLSRDRVLYATALPEDEAGSESQTLEESGLAETTIEIELPPADEPEGEGDLSIVAEPAPEDAAPAEEPAPEAEEPGEEAPEPEPAAQEDEQPEAGGEPAEGPDAEAPAEAGEPEEGEAAGEPEEPEEGEDETKRQTLSAADGSVSVNGVLPVDGSVIAVRLSESDAAGYAGADEKLLAAYDITICDRNGSGWQPEEPVSVSVYDDSFGDGRALTVYRADGDGRVFVADVASNNGSVTFKADHFSVYLIVGAAENARLRVNFHRADGSVVTVYVRQTDTADAAAYAELLYDPGVGTNAQDVSFYGWTTNRDYTASAADAASGRDIAGIRADVAKRFPVTEGPAGPDTVIDYYPMLYKSYSVTYLDQDDAALGTSHMLFRADDTNTVHSYTVNMAYTPVDNTHNFEGWKVKSGGENIEGWAAPSGNEPDGTVYPNETVIRISGSVVFSVRSPEGHWLIFDENGKGGTYTAPQFVKSNQVTAKPRPDEEMLRFGYTFGGWYAEAACATPFTFGQPLRANTTIYAKWTANAKANYTVILWKQNVDGTGYDFEDSILIENAAVGSDCNAVTVSGSGTGAKAKVGGTTYSWTGFHFASHDQSGAKVSTEGNTIVNVYYDRNTITLDFKLFDYSYTATTSNSGTQYGLVDGQYVQLTRKGSYGNYSWVYNGSTAYTGTRYTRSSKGWSSYKTMTGLYGSTLADNGYTWPREYYWYSNGNSKGEASGTRTTFMDAFMIPGGAVSETFYGATASAGSATLEFYKQKADLSGYELANTDASNVSNPSFNITDKYNGFTADHYEVNGNTVQLGEKDANGYYATSVSYAGSTLRIYFNRNAYLLNFMNGSCYNGNDVLMETVPGEFRSIEGIFYGADISSYGEGGADYFVPAAPNGYEGFTFAGWYIDDQCSQKYDFTTMKEGGVTVYAKWIQTQYRVFLHPNVPGATAPDWGGSNQNWSFRIDHGGRVSAPTGLLPGYEFVGWFRDPALTVPFNAQAYVLNDTTVTAPYDKTDPANYTDPDTADPMGPVGLTSNADITGYNGGDRFWITRKLDIYAKWRTTLEGDAIGISVTYDANGGSNAPSDPNYYVDEALAKAGAASTAPAGRVFLHWVVQRWNEEANAFVDTPVTVVPGRSFTVDAEDARIETSDTGPWTYTIRLRAEYGLPEQSSPTSIVWYRNDGSGAIVRQDGRDEAPYAELAVNEAVSIPAAPARSGYTFMGWYRVRSSSDTAPPTAGSASVNFLWYKDGTYYADAGLQTAVAQVAADERDRHDYMYAVWQPDLTIRITGRSDTLVYNGAGQSVSGYTVEYYVGSVRQSSVPAGVSVALVPGAAAEAKRTDVGTSPMGLSGASFVIGSGRYAFDPAEDLTVADGLLTITPAAVTITAADKVKAYGEADPALTAAVSGVFGADSIDYTLAREEGEAVGTYTITAAGEAEQGNYTVSFAPGTFTITKAGTLALSASGWEGMYDGQAHAVTASPSIEEGTAVNYSTDGGTGWSAEAPSITDAGEITVLIRAENANYETAEATAVLRVTPRPVTVTADDAGKAYGDKDGELTASATGLLGEDAVAYTLEREAGEDAGTYAITAAGEAEQDNYTVSFVPGTYTISRAEATVTADGKSKVYGEEDPELTAIVTGLRAGDDENVLSYTLKREKGENAGTYSITAAGEALQGNYVIRFVGADFTITRAEATVTADSRSKVYGDADPELTAVVSGLKAGDDESVLSFTLSREAGEDAGTYAIAVSGDAEQGNYSVSFAGADFTIIPAAITVTADDKTRTYGEADPAFTASVSGLKAGDDESVLSFTLSREAGEDVGTYEIAVSGDAEQGNYTVSFAPGTLTIAKSGALALAASDRSWIYDGEAHPAAAEASVADGTTVTYSTDGAAWSEEAPSITDVGEIAVQIRAENPNYEPAEATAVLRVTPKPVTVTADDKSKTYGEDDEALTAAVSGLLGSDTVEYSLEREAGEDAGIYAITPAGDAEQGNYTVRFVSGAYTIGRADATVTADGSGKVYGDEDPALTAVVTGLRAGDDESVLRYALTRESGEDVGVYAIVPAGEAAQGNYNVTFAGADFTITPAEVTITADDKTAVYGDADPAFTASVSGLKRGDSESVLRYRLSREAGYDVGSYAVTVTAAAEQGNYTVVTVPGSFTITPAAVTVTAENKSKTYGDADPAFTAVVSGLQRRDRASVLAFTFSREEGEDAGTYEIAVSGEAEQGNYTVSFEPGTLTITKAGTLSLSATGWDGVYDAQAHDVKASASVAAGTKVLFSADGGNTWNKKAPSITDVGEITVQVRAENPNYEPAEATAVLRVTPKAVTVTADDKSKIYGDADEALTAAVAGLIGRDTVAYTLEREAGEDAGTYAITPAGEAEQGNYTVSFEPGAYTIGRAAATVTADGKSKTYGDEDEALTALVTGLRAGDDESVLSYSLSREEGEAAGSYAITASGEAEQGNYTVSYVPAVYTIGRAAVTVTADSASKTYGDEDPALTAVATGLIGDDTVSYTLTRESGENVGSYAVTASGEALQGSYTVAFVPAEFSIAPAAVTIAAEDSGKTYGDADPELTAVVTGLKAGDDESVLAFSLSREKGEDVGSYAVSVRAAAEQGNYIVTTAPAAFTITKAATLSLNAAGWDGVYDAKKHETEASASVTAGTAVSYSTDGGETWTDKAPSITDVGEITVQVRAENPNYEPAEAAAVLRVTPKAVTVTADDRSKTYGDEDPELTAVVTGLLGKDEIAFALSREAGEDAGTYAITPAGEAEQGNYVVRFTGADFTINPAAVTVSAENKSKTYGDEDPALTAVVTGLRAGDDESVLSYTLSREAGEDAGTYAIAAAGETEQGNYVVRFTGADFTINPAAVTVSAENKSKTYGDEDPELTAVVTGLKADDDESVLSYTLSREDGEDAGTYAVAAAGEAGQGNYTVSFTGADFTITPAAITVAAEDKSKTFGEADPVLTAAVTGLKAGDSESAIAYTLTREEGEDAGTYTITAAGDAEQGNYAVSFESAALTIGRAPVTVTAEDKNKTYGDEDPGLTAVVTGLLGDDTVEYTLSREAGEDAGEYAIAPAGEAEQGNYAVSFEPAALTIGRAAVTVTAGDKSKVFGEDDPALTAIVTGLTAGDSESVLSYTLTRERGENVGDYAITVSGGAEQGNYSVSFVPGTFSITKAALSLAAVSGDKLYDGEPLSGGVSGEVPEGVELRYSTDGGVNWSAEAPSLTDAGSVAYLLRAEGSNYETLYADGVLAVAQRSVVITSRDARKEYDGSALRQDGVLFSGDGFVPGQGVAVDVYGEQLLPGTSLNFFSYSLDAGTDPVNYAIRTVFGTLTVTDRDAPYTIEVVGADGAALYDGESHSIDRLAADVFTLDGHEYTVEGLTASCTAADAGTYPVPVTGTAVVRDADGSDVTAQFAVTTKAGTLTIRPRTVTLTSVSAGKTYDGTALTTPNDDGTAVAIGGDGFAAGEGVLFTMTGTRTTPGESENSFTYLFTDNTKPGNYEITTVFGALTVLDRGANERFVINVQANSAEAVYDGGVHSADGLVANVFLANGQRFTVEGLSAHAEATDAGTYGVNVTGTPVVRDAEGNDVTAQFLVNTEPGTLAVARRSVTFTSATASKEYDGDELTATTVTVGGEGFAEGEGADFSVTGARTVPGSVANSFTYALWANTKAENYSITKTEGMLTVRSREARYEITVTANSAEALYDGTVHSVEGLVTDRFTAGGHEYVVEGLTASASAAAAGTYPAPITGTAVVKDDKGNDVTAQFLLTLRDGSLTVNRRLVTLTSATASREYDGSELTAATVTVGGDGFAEGEGADFSVTGSQTVPGISPNTFTYALRSGTSADNYRIETSEGSLTVTGRKAPYALVVEANSGSALYDGQEHTVSGLKSTLFGVAGHSYRVSGLAAEAAGTHAGSYTVRVTGTAVVTDEKGNDVSAQFAVSALDGTLTIRPRTVTLTSATAEAVYTGSPLFDRTVTVGGDGFAPGEGAAFSVTGTRTIVGASENIFTYTLNDGTLADDYDVRTAFGLLTVTARPENALYEITVRANSAEALYDGAAHGAEGLVTESFTVGGNDYTVEGLAASRSETAAGSYIVNVTGTPVVRDAAGNDVTDQFLIRTERGTLRIGRRAVTLTSASASHAYNGRELRAESVTVSGDGFASGEGAVWTFSSGRTLVGESDNRFTYTMNAGTDEANYDVTVRFGKLTVTNRDARWLLTVTARSGEVLYDGTEKTVEGLESVNVSIDGVPYTITGLRASASGVDAGEYESCVEGTAVVLDADGNDVSQQFSVTGVNGLLKILPREITFTSASASKPYDGSPLTAEEVEVGGAGFAPGEGADWAFTGSRTLVGTAENSFTYSLQSGTKESNYDVTVVFGSLNVTSRDALYEVTLTANSDTVRYDGERHTVSGFKSTRFTADGHEYRVEGLKASASGIEAGVYTTRTEGTAVVLDADGNDVTDQFAVIVKNGTLRIENTYRLTVLFVDEAGNNVAEPFTARYAEGEVFAPVLAPDVEGLIPDSSEVRAPEGGMPARDVEVSIIYRAPAAGDSDPGDEPAPTRVNPDEDILEEIDELSVPFAAAGPGYWAMANLLLAVAAVLLALFQFGGRLFNKDETEEDKNKKRRFLIPVLSLLVGIGSVIVFLLTEDMTNAMTLFDRWTLLMAVLTAVSIVLTALDLRERRKEDEAAE